MSAAAEDRAQRLRGALGVAIPPLVWAAHFIAVYALTAAACAPRGLIAGETARILAAVSMVVALALCAVCARWAAQGGPGAVLGIGAFWSAAISAIAIITQTLPAALFELCA